MPVLLQVVVVVGGGALLGAAGTWALLRATPNIFGPTLSLPTFVQTSLAFLALGVVASLWAFSRILRVDPLEATSVEGR